MRCRTRHLRSDRRAGPARRRRHRLIGLAVALAAIAGCTGEGSEETAPPSWRYVALGDSVADGTGSTTSYPQELAGLLRGRGIARVRVQNLATAGQRSDELLESLRRPGPVRRGVASADLVTITIGANDLIALHDRFRAGRCGAGLACYRRESAKLLARWDAILELVLSLVGSDGAVRATNYYNPYPGNRLQQREDFGARPPPSLRPLVESLNASICGVAEGRGVPCADLYRAFNGAHGRRSALTAGLLAPDAFHPSAEGHRLIARSILALGLEPLTSAA